ncbi:endonuclease/exonuclease/phosphatase family protein [Streptococcus cuniculipharyngis]|uniref:Endonuclease/exonuclease/phosphatase family protein n=1 Tax=Streptococcus cuniculipharyngis TaxID=1562651 RepID=A0A5C5SGD5_9STRE|nr:endonuclease/exonuclease/phosphatase family protein [Streptococcus cuniculipharyngis]TWS98971.1 endonuclease/exonuclease/phosphatase family protein [Streptococcus cuniculipharyngis]
MKLLTLNVHAWLEDHQDEKLDLLAQVLAEKSYDVIALQEVNQSLDSLLVTPQLKEDNYGLLLVDKLNRLSGLSYSFYWTYSHIGYGRYEEGLAILTKLPVYAVDEFYCSQHQSVDSILSRKIIGLTLSYKGRLIDCYSCHINLPDSTEENQLSNIRTILNRVSTNRLALLMGDFNTDACSNPLAYQAILELGLVDTYELAQVKDDGITAAKAIDGWEGHLAQKRLDYIFLTQEQDVLSSQVIFNGKNYPPVSDHFGVEVEIKL